MHRPSGCRVADVVLESLRPGPSLIWSAALIVGFPLVTFSAPERA
jgi:hypothetical protein